jgi:hypothetical protein
MHYLPIQPNLESKTRHKQLLGSLPLDIALPGLTETAGNYVGAFWAELNIWGREVALKVQVLPRTNRVIYFASVTKISFCDIDTRGQYCKNFYGRNLQIFVMN